MKLNTPILSFMLLLVAWTANATTDVLVEFRSGQEKSNGNPLLPGYYADPTVVEDRGGYYLYATLDPWGGETLGCWSSEDFEDWTYHELNWPTKTACTSPTSKGAMVWAPSVVRGMDGKFYMYVSVGSEVWVGGADHPLGPWHNLLINRPLIPENYIPGYHMIDAEAFIDEDGKAWLYWGSGWNWTNGRCWVVPLKPDMMTFDGPVTDVTPAHYFEGPFMQKHAGKYYLMYSDGKTTEDTYQVHYAIGDNPLGPFDEAENSPILTSDHEKGILSPGHHTVVELDGLHYIIYHRHSIPYDPENIHRQVCVDSLSWDEDGLIRKIIPTHRGPTMMGNLPHVRLGPPPIGTFSASSVQSPDFRIGFVSDHNYATLWKPAAEDVAPWIQVDLLVARQLSAMKIRFEYAWKPYRFTVQYSDDGQNWKVLENYVDTPVQGSPVIIPTPIEARFVRLVFPDNQEFVPAVFEWSVD